MPSKFTILPSSIKNSNLLFLTLLAALCSASYLLATWRHPSPPPPSHLLLLPCTSSAAAATTITTTTTLDFSLHHSAAASDYANSNRSTATRQFPPCASKLSELTPCEGHRRSLEFPREKLEYRERHCPAKGEGKRCLVPAPEGYRVPFRWPVSRDVAWMANVPHKELVEEKGGQNWIKAEGEVFKFPGGGTMFSRGADRYIDEIGRIVPLGDGSVRTAVDTGCGVASWGAYLLPRNVITMSFAPKDTHEAQVQFALERGVPAMLGILATKRLPYPARSFDMAHCSRCLIPWHLYDGLYLIEIDRILRPGGYWILSGPPINWKRHLKGWQRSAEDLNSEQSTIESIARSLCWTKVEERGDIAVWQKPINHVNCKASKEIPGSLQFCSGLEDPDAAWYTKMEACITPLPEVATPTEVAGGEIKIWPERLMAVPPRIISRSLGDLTPELFFKDSEMWKKRVGYYKLVHNQFSQNGRYRNILDMNSGLGGFAAALVNDPVWVMNIMPTIAKVNTLGVIYDRGLIGTYQDWCEAMSTYPRTYDLLHADSLFSLYKDSCKMEDILLEMDRILRPEGTVIFRDDVDILVKIRSITDGMRWESKIFDHEDGPLQREKLLLAVKTHWSLSDKSQQKDQQSIRV